MRNIHRHAMKLVRRADSLIENNAVDKALRLYAAACQIEHFVAASLIKQKESEPTRSILYLSAASLAWRCKSYEKAERLVYEGLSGFPSPRTKVDLQRLLDDIHCRVEFASAVKSYEEGTIYTKVNGRSIGHGKIPLHLFAKYSDCVSGLILRIQDRLFHKSYESRNSRSKEYVDNLLIPNIVALGSGSFKFHIQMMPASNQLSIVHNGVTPAKIVNEFMENLSLFNDEKFDELHTTIGDEAYYTNFISLIKQIAPDGESVRTLSFSSKDKVIVFNKTSSDIKKLKVEMIGSQYVSVIPLISDVEGVLNAADMDKMKAVLKLSNRNKITLKVKNGLEDIARKYFGLHVTARVMFDDNNPKKGTLLSVDPVD